MSNELTDVRCPCGAEFQADSYDAGFIAGSGMCQNCDAAMPPKDIPAPVEQAGGDEGAAFNAWLNEVTYEENTDRGVFKVQRHQTLSVEDERIAWRAWQGRALLARSEQEETERLREAYEWGYGDGQNNPNGYSDKKERDACVNELLKQPSPAQAEQAERPEVVARVVHSTPVVLDQCAPLNANDEMMTVAQHAASVARWAEMFNRVEQERDAALASAPVGGAPAQHLSEDELADFMGDPSAMSALADGLESIKGNGNAELAAVIFRSMAIALENDKAADAFGDFEDQYLTDGSGHAPISTYEACREAFHKEWPNREAAFAAAKAEYDRLHPTALTSAHVAGKAVATPLRPLTEDERAATEFYALNPSAAVHDLSKRLSAPVAGEAQPVAWLVDWPEEPELGHCLAESPAETGRSRPLVFADAVTQISEPVYAYRRKGLDDFVTCDRERFDELSTTPRLFETRIFYTAPQASKPDFSDAYEGAREDLAIWKRRALAAKLAMAEDAAAKGDAARQQCGGMEMEIEELRAEAQALRDELSEARGRATGSVDQKEGYTGWVTQYPGRAAKLWGSREIAELNWWPEDGQQLFRVVEVERIAAPTKGDNDD
ncbi:TPA: hypothetical protein NIF35_003466 [Pseudomonas aeruginosa]|nr:hypothetical protein [Pseudomonas aeruginosa]